MPISSTCYQKLQIKLIRKYGATSFDVDAQSLLARTNFLVFRQLVCGHESPEHHQFWHQQLNTGVDSKCLKGIGGKHTLILSPRGAAKSTFLVEWTAWVIGVHSSPSVQIPIKILYTSYNIEVASLKSEQIQAIITSPAYRKVFPWVRPGRKWGSRLWEIDKAHAGLPMVDEPYTISCAGIKGAVASKRAHLCCTADTMVHTEVGLIPISDVTPEIKVASFNERSQRVEWKRVKNVASRYAADVVELSSAQGRILRCTPEHPVYLYQQSYRDAGSLLSGDTIVTIARNKRQIQAMPRVQKGIDQEKPWPDLLELLQSGSTNKFGLGVRKLPQGICFAPVQIQRQGSRRKDQFLLLSEMPRQQQINNKTLRGLQCDYRIGTQTGQGQVLSAVLKQPTQKNNSTPEALRVLPAGFYSSQYSNKLLLKTLCQQSTFQTNDGGREQPLQNWHKLQQTVFRYAAFGFGKGWKCLLGLWNTGLHNQFMAQKWPKWFDCASRRSQSTKQQCNQFNHSVSNLSLQPSLNNQEWQTDTISSVKFHSSNPQLVYDIEVEDNHNFFANGILVHNCVLDDLVKSPSQIENPKVREQMDNTWVNVIRPVIFEGGRAVCLGTRMSGLDLYATTFTEDRSWNVIEQSAIVEDDLGEEQSYWPSMVSFEHLDFLRTDDPTSFALQYQNKIPKEGMALIRQAYMPDGVPPTLEEFDSLIISSDFSASIKSQADYSVFLLLGKKGKDVWVLDIRRGRWQGNIDKCNVFLGMLLDWGFLETEDEYSVDYRTGELEWLCCDKEGVPRKPVIKSQGWFLDLYTESQSYQISFRSDWTRYMHDELGLYNLTCRPVAVRGDKMQRLVGVTGYFQGRRIWFNSFRANTLKKVKQELEGFGFTAKDDCVDALVLGVNCLGLSGSFDV